MDNNPALIPLPPTPSPVEVVRADGKVLILVRGVKVMLFDEGDVGAMHFAIVALVETHEVSAREVARGMGVHEGHVSRLRRRYRRHGSAGLVPPRPGPHRKSKLDDACIEQIRSLREQGLTQQDIAARTGVSIASVSRALQELSTRRDPEAHQLPLSPEEDDEAPGLDEESANAANTSECLCVLEVASEDRPAQMNDAPGEGVEPALPETGQSPSESEPWPEQSLVNARPVPPVEGIVPVQHAGAMMLHVPIFQLGLTRAFKTAGAQLASARVHDLDGVVGTLALGFGLGLANVEQFKLAVRGNLGPMAGLATAPEVRTLRRKLAELSGTVDLVTLQREVTRGLLRVEPVWEGLHYVDGHFTDYHGELPAPKTRDPKRHCAARGRTDTWVHDVLARPLFFLTSPVHDQLVSVMPRVVAEIKALAGHKWEKDKDGPIFLIFDRGGWSPDLFAWLVENEVDFASYLKGDFEPLADSEFRSRWWFFEGRRHFYELAETTLTLGEYTYRVIVKRDGPGAKQIPIITSLDKANGAKIVHLVKLRWRQENGLKDLVHQSFIDGIVEYGGDLEPDPTMILNPDREKLKVQLADLRRQRVALQVELGEAALDKANSSMRRFKTAHSEQSQQIEQFLKQEGELEKAISLLPARVRRCDADPSRMRAILRTGRRTMVNIIKLSVDNAERWLARKFQKHFKDPDEFRMQLRGLLQQPGELHYNANTGRLVTSIHPPDSPKVRAALAALLQDLNAESPRTLDGQWELRFALRGEA